MCDRKNLTVKLCDFGLSTFIRSNKPLETSCGTIMYGKVTRNKLHETLLYKALY